jgi:hypothetical protein
MGFGDFVLAIFFVISEQILPGFGGMLSYRG